MTVVLIIFTATIALYVLNRFPMGAVALASMLALISCGCISASDAAGSICNNTTLTMASMFVISAAFSKTSFLSRLSGKAGRIAAKKPRALAASYALAAFTLSQFIPTTTAVFALICPIISSQCKKIGIRYDKMLHGTALVVTSGAFTLTPIGPYAANYIENNTMQAYYGIEGFLNTPFTEMILKLPAAVFAILWAVFVSVDSASADPVSADPVSSDSVSTDFAPDVPAPTDSAGISASKDSAKKTTLAPVSCRVNTVPPQTVPKASNLTKFQDASVMILFFIAVVSLVARPSTLDTWVIPCAAACALVCLKVLTEKEALLALNMNVIIIYASSTAMGKALVASGVAGKIGDIVFAALAGNRNSFILGASFFLAALILSSLVYNRAVGRILIPIVLSTCFRLGADPRGLVQMCYIGSMCTLLTPASTTLVPMLTQETGWGMRDLLKHGILPSLCLCAVTVIPGMMLYPAFR